MKGKGNPPGENQIDEKMEEIQRRRTLIAQYSQLGQSMDFQFEQANLSQSSS